MGRGLTRFFARLSNKALREQRDFWLNAISIFKPISLGLFGVVAYQTADFVWKLWHKQPTGGWWSEVKSTEWYKWLFWPGVVFIWSLYYHARRTDKSLAMMLGIEAKLDRAVAIGLETVEVCIKFLNKTLHHTILNPEVWQDFSKDSPTRVQKAIESIGANLGAWSDRIKSHYSQKDQALAHTWLGYMETYFREEAFDIRRREIVTNGRNYPFMLMSTLATMLRELPSGHYLHYYAVTPVNPKDWYNWPHGWAQPRSYHEADFLALFRRSLQECIAWDRRNGGRLRHARFILAAANEDDRHAFGWDLDTFNDLCEDLKNCLVLDISVPTAELKNGDRFCQALAEYYEFVQEAHREAGPLIIVPLFGKHWTARIDALCTQRAIEKRHADLLKLQLKQVLGFISHANLSQVVTTTKTNLATRINAKVDELKTAGLPPKKVGAVVDAAQSDKPEFPLIIRELHELSLMLAVHREITKDLVGELTQLLLAYRACLACGATPCLLPLGELFAAQLHSSPEEAFIVKLTGDGNESDPHCIKHWHEKLAPEFAIFGISKEKACSPSSFGQIQWKLGLATHINYPFDAAKIRIMDNENLLNPYVKTLGTFLGDKTGNTQQIKSLLKTT